MLLKFGLIFSRNVKLNQSGSYGLVHHGLS